MAGGMRGGRGLALAERSALSGVVPDRSPDRSLSRGARRHCWVGGTAPGEGPWPGLVLDWQRTDAGWRGYVVYLRGAGSAGAGSAGAVAVQEWVDASRLTPAGSASH
jgi:hypothetical protein